MTKETPGQRPRMSLRDYFAARAMQALVSEMPRGDAPERNLAAAKDIAQFAYVIADAMFEARRK